MPMTVTHEADTDAIVAELEQAGLLTESVSADAELADARRDPDGEA